MNCGRTKLFFPCFILACHIKFVFLNSQWYLVLSFKILFQEHLISPLIALFSWGLNGVCIFGFSPPLMCCESSSIRPHLHTLNNFTFFFLNYSNEDWKLLKVHRNLFAWAKIQPFIYHYLNSDATVRGYLLNGGISLVSPSPISFLFNN